MSFSPPRVRNNGTNNNGTYQLYWCYQCRRTVRISSSDPFRVICRRCFGQFLTEIETPRPRLLVDFTFFDPSPEARLLEALSLILDPPIRGFNHGNGNLVDSNRAFRCRHQEPDVEDVLRRRRRGNRSFDGVFSNLDDDPEGLPRPSWIVLRPLGPLHSSAPPEPFPRRPENPVPPRVNPRDYYLGSGFHELIEELTQNDRPGPPPLPEQAIDAIPTVKITEAHLVNDSQCPVCMEEFKVGGEARELGCKHIYHNECIVPWLRMHNSCPVCRHEVRIGSESSGGDGSDNEDGRGRCLRLRRLASSLWPFGSRYRRINPERDIVGTGSSSHSQGRRY